MQIDSGKLLLVRSAFLEVQTAGELAKVLSLAYRIAFPERSDPEISTRSLNYLAFHHKMRYRVFEIPKRSGGSRTIMAPIPKLKAIQHALNVCFHSVFRPHKAAYGFVPDRSIVDNAQVHVGRHYVYNVDIKDFFPSTSFRRVKTVLELNPFALDGDREPLAFLIANLCCEQTENGSGALPQGAPTSPTLTNAVCQRLDRKMNRLARQNQARYTRYADDLSFSSNTAIFTDILRSRINEIVKEEGYEINQKKVRMQSCHIRQEVTGLTVNEKPNVRRSYIKDLRYWLRTWRVFGYDKATADFLDRHAVDYAADTGIPRMENVLAGKIAFLSMVRGKEDELVRRFRQDFADLSDQLALGPENVRPRTGSEVSRADVKASPEETSFLEPLSRILEVWERDGIDAAIRSLSSRKPSDEDTGPGPS